MVIKCDVLVVGAGPAGVSAAYFIKHHDKSNSINVDLVERLDSEMYKQYHDMCGEAVSKYLFDELLPLKPRGIVEEIKLIREYWPGDIEIDTPVKGYILDRAQFLESIIDEFRKKDGYFENKPVKAVSQRDSKVNVKFGDESKDYDYVIAADGANSMIRKSLGISGRTRNFIQYIIDKEPEQGTLVFKYDEKYGGDYEWIFPHEGKTKIGYPLIRDKVFKPKGEILEKQSRAIGYGGINRYVHGRILLVGDAACQTNALTKGGIRAGMIAGKIVANAIINGNPKKYESEWLRTDFSSDVFNESFKQLKNMNNRDLQKHIEPFKDVNMDSFYQRSVLYIKTLLLYRKYIKLYKAYDLANEAGW